MKIGPVDPEIVGLQGINDMAISAHRSESFNLCSRKLQSYQIKVYQIFTRCSGIIAEFTVR